MNAYSALLAAAIEYRRNPFDNDARMALTATIRAAEFDLAEQANDAAIAADDAAMLNDRFIADIVWSR